MNASKSTQWSKAFQIEDNGFEYKATKRIFALIQSYIGDIDAIRLIMAIALRTGEAKKI